MTTFPLRNIDCNKTVKDDKIIRLNGPIRSIRGSEGGTEDLLVCLSDFHIFIVLIPKLGSTLKKESLSDGNTFYDPYGAN